jgi:hypothetical protein
VLTDDVNLLGDNIYIYIYIYIVNKNTETLVEISKEVGPPLWSRGSQFLAADPEVLGSIPVATRFSAWQWIWNGVHSDSWG